ncbi:hypothetical protein CO115_01430 [Candidatus Falkowbacteria bacterium CG_4_9_14_3_um_filter_36_9]|uniref:Uncharacterized protein n=1 Tax=Candidatus Falkowbacteria bacterium CG02_land_8_20_14_3_00_36_14 TaxID=1974560 RepID=A0A2M7DPM2_9BACT|nr:MAG: hypothetical protein COS18_02175 [Candidatus Falkowbacteria bacterium CG02_land_8_20_14_3_00_36_14]PJB20332.1 MAG: hypothetical protein CO115_01430 [Candidatus Falkowbacteria bacterium CG_4_9_14_3_um_filter_36_9]
MKVVQLNLEFTQFMTPIYALAIWHNILIISCCVILENMNSFAAAKKQYKKRLAWPISLFAP